MRVAVIGGGASGFFAALSVMEHHKDAEVVILEKSKKVLSKVKVSGGGRCNVTNAERDIKILSKAYPRGASKLKRAFYEFGTTETIEWFESRGVPLVAQEDGCIFPKSQDSQTVIDCFLRECERHLIAIRTGAGVTAVEPADDHVDVIISGNRERFDKVIIATGGSPMRKGMNWLDSLQLEIEDPVPSLFTFNMPTENVRELMGVVVVQVQTSIPGTKLKGDGPLLITHWGMSGPAILKLSAFGARVLHDSSYDFNVLVNWVDEVNHTLVTENIRELTLSQGSKIISNYRPYQLPERLWHYMIDKIGLSPRARWADIGKKGINKIVNVLTNDSYKVDGKTTFKEEFVTCGGVSLASIDFKTMASRSHANIYFAGELTDVDGITGGYNFQSAWTTGYIAGRLG